jgi:hypothetical protein
MRQESTDLAALVTRLEKELRNLKLALTAVLIMVGGAALIAWVRIR